MPLFRQTNETLAPVPIMEFNTERELQRLIEANLMDTFGCRFIASEFSTGEIHGGRMDTLGLSEDKNPAVFEYKKDESANLINQALYYYDWLKDHHGDFELAAAKALGGDVEVDWSRIRVICLAASYDKYALHAVRHIGVPIELWRYRRFTGGYLEIEEVFRQSTGRKSSARLIEDVESDETIGKPQYTVEDHLNRGTPETVVMFNRLQEAILELDASIIEVPQKLYIAYKLARNLVCVEIQRKKVVATLNRRSFEGMPANFHDLTGKGHWGTGDVEVHIASDADLEAAVRGIRETYLLLGGD